MTHKKQPMRDTEGRVNTYVITASRFVELYEISEERTELGVICWSRSKVEVEIFELPEGFDILAPWGNRQTAEKGYLVLNSNDVYGIHADIFANTYSIQQVET